MSAIQSAWADACSRLGVNPRQFALLGGVMVAAVGLLVFKVAGPATPAKAAAARPAPLAPTATPAKPRAVEFSLEEHPSGNPFAPLAFQAAAAVKQANAGTPSAAASAPSGMRLTATLSGEFAVINGRTAARGAVVIEESTGNSWVVREIGLRHVELESDGRVVRIPLDG